MANFIDYNENNGKYNMQMDLHILNNAIESRQKSPIVRLYGWAPACVSLGRNQTCENINIEYCKNNNIDVVKRITGGRGLLHDDEVTYSFVCPIEFLSCGDSVIASYKKISSAIIYGFKHIGIELSLGVKKKTSTSFGYCMLLSTGADLCFNGKKIIGSAQYRKQGYILQHGSILFSYDKEKIKNIFNEEADNNSITCLKEIDTALSKSDIINVLKHGFQDYFDLI